MKILRGLVLLSMGFGGLATAQSWDTSGNNLLTGTYYFRHVVWIPNANNLNLRDAASFDGTASFDGHGNYTVSATVVDSINRTPQAYQATGTYSIAASGQGFMSSPASTYLASFLGAANSDSIHGLVAQGIFVGSSTENQSGYSDLFIAMPAGATLPTNASFAGTYALAELDHPTGNPLDARDSLVRLTAGGNGNLSNISATSFLGGSISPVSQSIQTMQYSVNNTGLLLDTRGIIADSILTPRVYALHISSDGTFVFGGAPDGWDMVVGVRAANSAPNFSSIYYQAGLDVDLSQLANGTANAASYFGSLDAVPSGSLSQGLVLEHQRRVSKARSVYDFTFSDAYLFNTDATYDDALLSRHYMFSSDGKIRIGVGTGSSLGISIALQSPTPTGTGVFIDPRGITNSGSTGLFTSRIAPGELLTIYGTPGSTFAPAFQYDPTFPLTLGGVQVRINNRLAPILTLDPASNSVSIVVPYATTEPIASIQLTYNGTQSNTVTVFTGSTAAGVLTRPPGGVSYAAARRATDATIINPTNPARIGEFISVYLTGLGAVNPTIADNTPAVSSEPFNRASNAFRVFVDGVESTPLQYVGLTPTVVGLGVINVMIPGGVSTGQDVKVEVRGPDAYTAQALLSIAPETGTATVTATSGGDQTTQINTTFAARLVATVRDAAGNPLNGVTVTFSPVGSGANASFVGVANTATTNSSGVATSGPLTANGLIGSFKVVASAPGARSAIFNLANTPRTASTITATSGTPQSAAINSAFAAAFVATVKDSAGTPVNGVVVTFASTGNTASGTFTSGNKAVTDASGVATSNVFTSNGLLGSYTVTATAAGVGTPASFSVSNIAGTASLITATSGTPQATAISTAFVQPLVVTVKDSLGNPVSGITVTFTAPASGASVTFAGGLNTATTNASGVATSAGITANATAGSYTVTASASGVAVPASFSLTNTSGNTPTISATGGTPQSTPINTAFTAALVATVKDASGNPLGGQTVTFTAPASGASGTFANGFNTAVTNGAGVATAGVFTANGTGGSYTVTASAPGVAAPATFSLTNSGGATATITPTAGTPQTATVSTAFATRLAVTVRDSGGNPSSGLTVTFTSPSSGASGTFAGGTFGGTVITATTNASGVATSPVFTANGTAGGYTVTATVPGLLVPANFALTNTAGSPSAIAATAGTPQSTPVNTAFATRLAATVKDAGGNGIGGLTVTFTAPSSGASGAFAGGVITATTNTSGIATSATFTANGNPGGYTVTASVAGVSTPASFSLTNITATPASIVVTSGTPQSATISTAYAAPLVATVKDSGGNPVSGAIVTFNTPASGASGTFAGGNTAATNASGIATSGVFTANGTAGSYTVAATVAGVATPANFALTNLAGSAASIATSSGTPQSTSVSTAFSAPLAAIVKDSGGNPLSGLTVTFTAPGSGASGTFAGGVNTATTNAAGVATSPVFTANATPGSYTVSAAVAGVATPASFSLTNSLTPASIVTSSGTPQTTTVNSAFSAPLVVTVKDASNNPVSGAIVTYSVPPSGASGTFAGNVNTATTNASGIATSPIFTANATVGSYTVAASVPGVATTANFSLTNATPADITLTGASVGQNLQTSITLTLSQPAPAGTVGHPGLDITLTSSDQTKLRLAGRPIDTGVASLVITVPQGTTSIGGIFVQGIASSGTAVVTASAANYNNGTAIITLTPAGFSLTGPAGAGTAFTVSQGSSTPLTVSSVQLDANAQIIQSQQVRGGLSVSVPVTSQTSSVGTLTPSPVVISGGSNTGATQFNAASAGQTTLAAGVPSGFTAPVQGSSMVATVSAPSMSAGNAAVGKNLVNSTQVGISGSIPAAGLTMTLTSNNPSLMVLSTTQGGAGSTSITIHVPQFATVSPPFFVQGVSDSGSATYTASMPGFTNSTGTVTLGPSGFVIAGPSGQPNQTSFSTTSASANSTVTVFSALLDSSLNFVTQMPVITSVPVTVTSGTGSVGTITTSPVTIVAGSSSATTQFHPLAAGSSVLSITQPAGFSTPAQFASITANVADPNFLVTEATIGFNLQAVGTVTLGAAAPAGGLDVTLMSNSASLLLSSTGAGTGSASITVHIPANNSTVNYYLQATSGSGSTTYTATVPGYGTRTAAVTFTPSGVVIAGNLGGLNPPNFFATVSGGPISLTLFMAQLDPATHSLVSIQALAGGKSVSVGLTNSTPSVGTVATPITINGGPTSANGVGAQFTPISAGNTVVGVTTPTGGYTTSNTNVSVTGTVTQ